MRLHELLLSDKEKTDLCEIYNELFQNTTAKKIIRLGFIKYNNGLSQAIDKYSVSRMFGDPAKASYFALLVLYDFSFEELFPAILRDESGFECSSKIIDSIKLLSDERQRRNIPSVVMPQQIAKLDYMWEFMQRVPPCFINEFIGYRRSTSSGNIIQYYINLERTNSPYEVSVENAYTHNGKETIVRGFGVYINKSLYVIGHATTENKSSGMRVLALRQHADSDYLCGIVFSTSHISVELDIPIAARELLIPTNYHINWPQQLNDKEMNKKAKMEMIFARYGDIEDISKIVQNLKYLKYYRLRGRV